jgi:hypothetical protein
VYPRGYEWLPEDHPPFRSTRTLTCKPDLARNFSGFLQSVKGPGARNWYASTNSSQASYEQSGKVETCKLTYPRRLAYADCNSSAVGYPRALAGPAPGTGSGRPQADTHMEPQMGHLHGHFTKLPLPMCQYTKIPRPICRKCQSAVAILPMPFCHFANLPLPFCQFCNNSLGPRPSLGPKFGPVGTESASQSPSRDQKFF